MKLIHVKVEAVTFDETTQMGVVLLVDLEEKKIIPIWVGLFEAQAILFKIKDMAFPRPLTHDLLHNSITSLQGKLEYVLISDIKEGTYYAELHVKQNRKAIVIDSRPSDAIALSLRAMVPIYLSESVYAHSYDKDKFFEEQKQEYYRRFLTGEEDTEDDTFKLKH